MLWVLSPVCVCSVCCFGTVSEVTHTLWESRETGDVCVWLTIDGVVLGHRCKSSETAGCEPRSLHVESPAFHCGYSHTKHQVPLPPLTVTSIHTMTTFIWCCHHGKAIARVHPVHLMNADWAPDGRQPSNQANRLGLWVRGRLQPSTSTITIDYY